MKLFRKLKAFEVSWTQYLLALRRGEGTTGGPADKACKRAAEYLERQRKAARRGNVVELRKGRKAK